MRPRTMLPLLIVLAGTVALLAFLTLGGFDGGALGGGDDVSLTERWVSDTGTDIRGNHHAVTAGRVEGRGMVYAPVSSTSKAAECGLVALDATDGREQWRHDVPAEHCTIHSVADPTLADFDGDGSTEVLAATSERAVAAFGPFSGETVFTHDLKADGYTRPVVADLDGDGTREVVVVDIEGTVVVVRPDGTTAWTKPLGAHVWGQPAVADFDGDGERELAVGLGSGDLYLFDASGKVAWHRGNLFGDSVTWMTTGQADDDPGRELVVATYDGVVAVVDGSTGRVQWRHDFGKLAAVRAFGDGDEDGDPEIYAVAKDGKLRALDAGDGSVEWTTPLTDAEQQMMPPPSLGEVDGKEGPDLVAVTNDGTVSVVDPASGDVRGTYERDVSVFTHPTLADTDGDGADEVYVMYGDGRVVALSATDDN